MPGNKHIANKKYPYALCANQWVRSLQVFEENNSSLQNVIEIKYEDLAEDPSGTINYILTQIGLEKFPDDYFDKSFSVHEKKSTIKNMNASSFKRLSDEDIEQINKHAGDYLTRYNYQIL